MTARAARGGSAAAGRPDRLWVGMMSFGDRRWASWLGDDADARRLVQAALDRGIVSFDTANFYSDGQSEAILGRLIASLGVAGRVRVATKVGMPAFGGRGLRPDEIRRQAIGSLQRLGVERIDLYQTHTWDPDVPIAETLQALDRLVDDGLVARYGCSNLDAVQLRQAADTAAGLGLRGFATAQLQLNLLYAEECRQTLPECRRLGLGVLAYSPLARGALADGGDPGRMAQDPKAQRLYGGEGGGDGRGGGLPPPLAAAIAEARQALGASQAEVAMAWALAQPAVAALVIGARAPAELDVALRASALTLPPAHRAALSAAVPPRPFLRVGIPAG